MKSAVETLEPTKVKLTVEVDYDELKPSIDHAYKHIAEQVTIPGFRKGKVPPRIIDQRVGWGAVVEHAVNEDLGRFYGQAAAEQKLRPLGQPNVEVTEIPAKAGEGSLKFTAEVEVRPEIELPELSTLDITVESTEVADADVTERLDALRERFGTLVGVDRPAVEGDYVVVDLKAVIGDEEVDSVSGISYQIGSGNMLEGLDEALTGLSADETTTFTAPLAGGDHAGEEATVTVTATSVKQRDLPEADDDFAQLASEFDTLDELTADLREQVASIKKSNQAVTARDALLEKLLAAVEIPVPSGAVEAEVHRHLEGEDRLEDDAHRAEVTVDATAALKNQILLDTLAEKLEVKVGQGELVEYLVQASRQYGMEPQQFIQTLDQGGQIPAMVGEVARSKALAVALRQIDVKDGEGNVVDLSEFIGSDDADTAAEALEGAVAEAAAAEETDEA
ncbi:trigger factor [Xylanimonas cellulosilytica DSM 15894]|uniref:Trigger factor n=1 Tax=Xylanimonas cellulosilytica (strain DSM 15894 / JCM 12276 / CECT 5975 / KCTC 9989 / LMG 20990 / NBRC 107835 / XIL07) TaxID=446471 RepID=D1BZJ5_XYLCX|nr:trigger factor [Xylanimonas cellulosilytica]ACZ30149.1 trigger factor [Xylanimonas cellulosilytica DSM 15894]